MNSGCKGNLDIVQNMSDGTEIQLKEGSSYISKSQGGGRHKNRIIQLEQTCTLGGELVAKAFGDGVINERSSLQSYTSWLERLGLLGS